LELQKKSSKRKLGKTSALRPKSRAKARR
jgi:hypothetical protein